VSPDIRPLSFSRKPKDFNSNKFIKNRSKKLKFDDIGGKRSISDGVHYMPKLKIKQTSIKKSSSFVHGRIKRIKPRT